MYRFQSRRIADRRQALNLRSEYLAVTLGRCDATIRAWESGRTLPSPRQLAELADVLECAPGDFFEVAS